MDLGPDIETHHHHHGARAWVDVVIGVSAVMISLISLILAISNGRAMERLVQGNTWPYVMAGVGNSTDDGQPRFILLLLNKGVGPAKIETLEVFFRGKAVAGRGELLRRILGIPMGASLPPFEVLSTSVTDGVLSSKETVNLLVVRPGRATKAQMDALRNPVGELSMRVCYCSVFDECSIRVTARRSTVRAVKACPRPKVPFEG